MLKHRMKRSFTWAKRSGSTRDMGFSGWEFPRSLAIKGKTPVLPPLKSVLQIMPPSCIKTGKYPVNGGGAMLLRVGVKQHPVPPPMLDFRDASGT